MYNQKLMIEFSELQGNRIDLISINKNHLNDMHEYSIMPEFYQFLEYEPFKTISETEKYLQKLIDISQFESGHYWFIKYKKEEKMIGTFDIINVDKKRSSCEIGYGISPKYWKRGFFNECLEMVLPYLFNELQLHRVFAKTHFKNTASIKGLKKVGFKEEGIIRDFYFSKDEKWHDAILLSILENEFVK